MLKLRTAELQATWTVPKSRSFGATVRQATPRSARRGTFTWGRVGEDT